jgi:hypothetical protein
VRGNKALSILIAVETNGEVCTEMRESQVADLPVIEFKRLLYDRVPMAGLERSTYCYCVCVAGRSVSSST